nr:uncharacterized protein LOC127303970 [Lolium perenne]
MPSWDDGESSDDSLLSEFADGHDLRPHPSIPATILEPNFDSDFRCKHGMPIYKYVCYEGENTGRKFLGCGCKDDAMCDKIHWVDGPWPVELDSTKNYRLVLAKRDLEKRDLELHKQLGNVLEYVVEVTTNDLELETARRQKAKQEVASAAAVFAGTKAVLGLGVGAAVADLGAAYDARLAALRGALLAVGALVGALVAVGPLGGALGAVEELGGALGAVEEFGGASSPLYGLSCWVQLVFLCPCSLQLEQALDIL